MFSFILGTARKKDSLRFCCTTKYHIPMSLKIKKNKKIIGMVKIKND